MLKNRDYILNDLEDHNNLDILLEAMKSKTSSKTILQFNHYPLPRSDVKVKFR